MSDAGPEELASVNTRLNTAEYIRILENVLMPSDRLLYLLPARIILVQGNSAVHTSRAVSKLFGSHPEIELLPLPLKSPDLNPIENLWGCTI
ncbi:hypothetical protein Trydic_g17548 [Trypoxylus dichotomus]